MRGWSDMIDTVNGKPLEFGEEVSSSTESGNLQCRHCGSGFSTHLSLQQHIVCDHKEELRMELNQYQHKKHRILEDLGTENGKYIHPKKRKILEVTKQQNDVNGPDKDVKHGHLTEHSNGRLSRLSEDSLLNGAPLMKDTTEDDNFVEREGENYAHKKLRKDVFENKDLQQEKEVTDIDGFIENIGNRVSSPVYSPRVQSPESGRYNSQTYSSMPSFERAKNFHPDGNLIQDRNFPTNVQSDPMYRPPVMPNLNSPQQRMYPTYPAINMNMFGNFAMPLNVPHPMMYMNPGMFMPPVSSSMMPQSQESMGTSSSPVITEHFAPRQNIPPPPYSPVPPQKSRPSHVSIGNMKQNLTEDKSSNSSIEEDNSSIKEIYECKVCSRKFSQVGNFHNHMKLHSEKVCVCGICKLECADSYELQRHMRTTHTGNMPYKCNECDREFSQYNNLRRHLRVHSGKTYKCHICGRTFNEVFYLEMHIGSHTGERTYKCGVCNLTFRDNSDLQKHVKTHKAEELHTCDVCGKSFSKACVLRQHKKMHLGIRPYKCEVCSKAFIHRHHLTIHMRMHASNKPYTCKLCKKDFSQTSHLYKHIRQHAAHVGADISLNIRGGSSPTVAEIEEMFEKIRTSGVNISSAINSDMSDSNSQDAVDKEVAKFSQERAKPLPAENAESKLGENVLPCKQSGMKEPSVHVQGPYSPISSASSQCDTQSDAGSIDVVNTADSPTAQEIQEIMKSSETAVNDRDEIQLPVKSDQPSSLAGQEKKITPNTIKLEADAETKTASILDSEETFKTQLSEMQLQEESLTKFTEKMPECELPLLDTERREPDVEAAATESNSDVSKIGSVSGKSTSPCSSWSSRSDVSHADSGSQKSALHNPQRSRSSSFSIGSPSDEELRSPKQLFKQKPKRRNTIKKKQKRDPDMGHVTSARHENVQNPLHPPVMSTEGKITSEMQSLYLMQLQQLQGLHMALFANAMMTQGGMMPGLGTSQMPSLPRFPGMQGLGSAPLGMMENPAVRTPPRPGHLHPGSPHAYSGGEDASKGRDNFDRTGAVDLRVEKT